MERKGLMMKFEDFLGTYFFFLDKRDSGEESEIRCDFCKEVIYSKGIVYECCDKMEAAVEKQRESRAFQVEKDEEVEKAEKDAIFSMNRSNSDLDGAELTANFTNYKPVHDIQFRNIAMCQGYCDDKTVSLILAGAVGTGKTHLAVATLKYIGFHQRKSFGILRCSQIYEKTGTIESETYTKMDVLVIDDIGREGGSEARSSSRIAFISEVIEARMRKRKKTVFTTNLNSKELRERYGAHIVDRMMENSTVAKRMEFESYRTKS